MPIDDRPTLAAPDDDPYLWLEEIEGRRALDFVERQNHLTLDKFGGAPFAADRDIAGGNLRPAGQHSLCHSARSGSSTISGTTSAIHAASGAERRLRNFASPIRQWETLLDVDRLAADEGADWLLNWTQTRPGKDSRAILGLSRGGSDAVTLREFDMNTCTFVAGGFVLPEAKGSVDWLDADTLLLSSAFGEGMATASGLCPNRPAMAAGQDAHRAPVIFETSADHMGVHCTVDDTGPTPRIWIVDQLDFFNFDIWLSDGLGRPSEARRADRRLAASKSQIGLSSSCVRPGRWRAGPMLRTR